MPPTSLEMGGAAVSSIGDLLAVMDRHLQNFDAACDHRAAFLRVYRTMTGSVNEKLAAGEYFLDRAWIERVAVRFAWRYFDALDRYQRDQQAPPAWAYAFDVARRRRGFLLQDILLGMNAHINNDLPLVVDAILRDEADNDHLAKAVRRRFDHDQINRVLFTIIPAVEQEVARHYGRLILPLGRVLGTLDQALSTYGLKTWRDNVWRNAQFLLAVCDETERRRVIHFIEEDALHVARQIERLPPLSWFRPLAPLMRRWKLC
jgi:hypothetical protein